MTYHFNVAVDPAPSAQLTRSAARQEGDEIVGTPQPVPRVEEEGLCRDRQISEPQHRTPLALRQ